MIRRAAAFFALALALPLRAEVTPGEILIAEMNCVACHDAGPLNARLASRQSPQLGADGTRVTPQWLREFLADPQKTQPGTLMPDVLHALPAEQKAEAAEALTHFLISLQTPATEPPPATSATLIADGERLYHTIGCVMCHAPLRPPAGRENDAATRNELARLQQTAVPLGASLALKFTLPELARFLRDPLKPRPAGRMPAMNLTEAEATAIAAYLLREQPPATGAAFALDPAKAARGSQLFAEMNCAACHGGTGAAQRPAKPLARLSARQPRGCLSARPAAGVPKFELTNRQRQVILALLQEQTPLHLPLDAAHQIRRAMTTLNCYACHVRDRRGGPDGLRREYLTSTGPADLGDEARVPPPLTGIGARLSLEALRLSLAEGVKTRPHMATRMPRYGAANTARLPELFQQADAASPPPPQR